MEPALKQRLIGAIVLVALAVIFLPMLIKGPAPESGVADMPLDMPEGPQGEFETRELPLLAPAPATPEGGVVGMPTPDGTLPTVDTRNPDAAALANGEGEGGDAGAALPPRAAAGDHAVNFGSYASDADATRVVQALAAVGLPGYQDTISGRDNRTLHRVRIGPYATRADAEIARIAANEVNPRVDARVVTLDAEPVEPAGPSDAADAAEPARPVAQAPAEPPPAREPEPARTPEPAPVASAPAPRAPAAADVGFAVQIGAFSQAAQAGQLRDKARAAGFSSFIEQVQTDQGTLSRVRVGPVGSRAEAEALKAEVAAKLGVDGMVRPHP